MRTLRTLAVPAVILLSGSLLAGCGDDAEPADGSDEMMEETMEEDSMEGDDMEHDDSMEDEDAMDEDDAMEDEG